jgi:site-specific DNA-methyltransferase (adenine-specific)
MEKKRVKLYQGDNIESLKKLPDNSIDSVVTDPPYGISFMNRKWDYDVPSVDFWKEVYRVLKPGGHILSFGGTRTYHRMVVNIEDAGFEIRDQIQWIYGSGFPKSHNIGKAVDKLEGNEREVVGERELFGTAIHEGGTRPEGKSSIELTKGTSPYEGWGTALKPANEPICVARKPLSEKSVAENVLKWGTGGINVDGCRVGTEPISHGTSKIDFKNNKDGSKSFYDNAWQGGKRIEVEEVITEGRFPANIILECICDEVIKGEKGELKPHKSGQNALMGGLKGGDNSASGYTANYIKGDKGDIHTDPNCPCRLLDEQSGESKSSKAIGNRKPSKNDIIKWSNTFENGLEEGYNDKGGASRFFYQAKVSKAERNMGLDGFEDKESISQQVVNGGGTGAIGNTNPTCQNCKGSKFDRGKGICICDEPNWNIPKNNPVKNSHPTVKPINLMAYLCRLITPEGGIVLDPFMGSGSTGVAALLEGFRFVGMEQDKSYFDIASARIESYEKYKKFKK